jgi:CheY-like chemotaxis protein
MPIIDGLSCARRVRELEQAKEIFGHVPIIGITANARVEQIVYRSWYG